MPTTAASSAVALDPDPPTSRLPEVIVSFTSITAFHPTIGLIGYDAFGRLIAQNLAPHAGLRANAPCPPAAGALPDSDVPAGLVEAARGRLVILAVPVSSLAQVVAAIARHLEPGALVIDGGSVKILPVQIMTAGIAGRGRDPRHPSSLRSPERHGRHRRPKDRALSYWGHGGVVRRRSCARR
jgi:hypothetical protein